MKPSLALAAVLFAACGLRSIPGPDGGTNAGGAAGGDTAGGSTAGGAEAGGAAAGGAEAGGTGGSGGGGCMSPQDCSAPPNGSPACTNGVCSFSCTSPLLRCPTTCCSALSISAGNVHTCVTTSEGRALCWGGMFAIGNGSTAGSPSPTMVLGMGDAGVATVACGNTNACALTTGGAAFCWGAGGIGDGFINSRTVATAVSGIGQGATSITCGAQPNTCAVVDGGAKCWGLDTYGLQGCNQMCRVGGPYRLSPGPVTGLAYDVRQVSCGVAHCCALLDDGGVQCWGFNNSYEVGDGTTTQRWVPVVATALDAGVDQVYTGFGFTCARSGAVLRCFGVNGDGELGSGALGSRPHALPVLLGSGLTAVALSAVSHHACAVVDAGVWCWGRNDRGQLGDGFMTNQPRPVRVLGLSEPMTAVAVGQEHSCALSASGGVWCWGSNVQGQLGTGTAGGIQLQPQQVR